MKFMKILPIKSLILIILLIIAARTFLINYKPIVNYILSLNPQHKKAENKLIFEIEELSDYDKSRLIETNSWNPKCPVRLEDLQALKITFKNFKGQTEYGRLIVNRKVAGTFLETFKALYEIEFPLQSVKPIYEFDGDDKKSMEANNTTAFHCRPVTYSKSILSKHSYGNTIDINPIQNPYIRRGIILPEKGKEYKDRSKIKYGMVEPIIDLMKKIGFKTWAGEWDSPTDYMHFEYEE